MLTTRPPGRRAGLSRDVVLAAAGELLQESGLDGLTMRALARRLGVAPNALYSHVPSKTALLDDLLDDLLGEVEGPGRRHAAAGLERVMLSTYDVLLAHPGIVPAYVQRRGARGPNAERLGRQMTGLLERAGVSGPDAREAVHVLVVHVIGAAAFATAAPGDDDVEQLDVDRERLRAGFRRSLRWLLAGILARG